MHQVFIKLIMLMAAVTVARGAEPLAADLAFEDEEHVNETPAKGETDLQFELLVYGEPVGDEASMIEDDPKAGQLVDDQLLRDFRDGAGGVNALSSFERKSNIRLSVKTLLESDGSLPQYNGYGGSRNQRLELLVEGVDRGNRVLTDQGTRYRLDLLESVELDGLAAWNATPGVSEYCPDKNNPEAGEDRRVPTLPDCCRYYRDRNNNACGNRLRCLDRKASLYPELYAYREDAVNAYALSCSGRSNNGALHDGILIFRPNPKGPNVLHEVGHHLALSHTHNGQADPRPGVSCASLGPGDDGVGDTAQDHSCWTINDLSLSHCRVPYDEADAECRETLHNTYANLMSYHNDGMGDLGLEAQSRLTAGQVSRIRALHGRRRSHRDLRLEYRPALAAQPTELAFQNALLRLDPTSTVSARARWVAANFQEQWIKEISFERTWYWWPEFKLDDMQSDVIWDGYAEVSPKIGPHSGSLVFSPNGEDLMSDEPDRQVTYTVEVFNKDILVVRIAVYDPATGEYSEHDSYLVRPGWRF